MTTSSSSSTTGLPGTAASSSSTASSEITSASRSISSSFSTSSTGAGLMARSGAAFSRAATSKMVPQFGQVIGDRWRS
jgi:hypothetical protein